MNGSDLMFIAVILVGAGIWAASRFADKLPPRVAKILGSTPPPTLPPLQPLGSSVSDSESLTAPLGVPEPPREVKPAERHTELLRAIVDAGLPDGLNIIDSSEDEYGTVYTIKLPAGMTLDTVARKKEELASALSAPGRLIEVSATRNDAADIARVWVGKLREETNELVSLPPRTNWSEPFRIGVDLRGRVIPAMTTRTNTLIGGMMRQGKTTLERHFAIRAILDPETIVILVDGKGSVKDWEAAERCVNVLILGSDDDALEKLSKVFQWVIKESDHRNAQRGREHAGIVIILDELQDLFASADKAAMKALVKQLSRVLRKGAAAGVHVVIGTQRPGGDEIPTTVRDVIEQKIGLKARDRAAMDLILGKGQTGDATLPTTRGEALYMNGEEPVTVRLDNLTDEEWERACQSAPERATLDLSGTESVLGFFDRIIAVMLKESREVMSVEELAKALGSTTIVLGRELSANGYVTRRDSNGKKAVWLQELQSLDNQDG